MSRAGQSDQEQTPLCLFCGEPEELSISEIWSDHIFQLSTCCPDLLDQVSHEINADPAWGRDLLRRLGAEELTGHQESPLVAHSATEADPAICSVPPAGSAEHFPLGLGGWAGSKQLGHVAFRPIRFGRPAKRLGRVGLA